MLELHTLGVDGGYTQKDVTEVARCFTGWTINSRNAWPKFNPKCTTRLKTGSRQGLEKTQVFGDLLLGDSPALAI